MKLKKITELQTPFRDRENAVMYAMGWNECIEKMEYLKAEKKEKAKGPNWTPELVDAFNAWKPETDKSGLLFLNQQLIKLAERLKELFASQDRENKRLHELISGVEGKHIGDATAIRAALREHVDHIHDLQQSKLLQEHTNELHLKLINDLIGRIEKLEK